MQNSCKMSTNRHKAMQNDKHVALNSSEEIQNDHKETKWCKTILRYTAGACCASLFCFTVCLRWQVVIQSSLRHFLAHLGCIDETLTYLKIMAFLNALEFFLLRWLEKESTSDWQGFINLLHQESLVPSFRQTFETFSVFWSSLTLLQLRFWSSL